MKNLLKLEVKKFIYSYALWCILIVLLISSSISIFTNVYDASTVSKTIYSDSMVLLIAGAIYAGLSITGDFQTGFIRQYLVVFKQRSDIIFAKFIHFQIGCFLILFLYPFITLVISMLYQGTNEPFLLMKESMIDLISVLPYYCAIYSMFFAIAILTKKDGITLGIAIPFSILGVVFTERLMINFDVLKYSPIIQIQQVLQQGIEGSVVFISVILAFIIIALSLSISVFKLQSDEF